MNRVCKVKLERFEKVPQKAVRTVPPTKISNEQLERAIDLVRSVIRRPLGTDPERDKEIMDAWGSKG
jgi:hypothetical protein